MALRCELCFHPIESLIHVLRDCPVAKGFWIELGIPGNNFGFFTTQANIWLKDNCRSHMVSGKYHVPWKILFPFVVWQLWLHRNRFIFSKGVIDMKFIILCVGKSTEFSAIVPNFQPKPPRTFISFKWEPFESGWIKLSTDGASNSTLSRAGGGGLLRNSDGNWIRGFSRSMGTCSSLMAELWALKDGLYLAKELGFSSIYIEVDAELIVGLLFNPSCVNLVMEPLLFDCRNLLQDFTNPVVQHVFREAN